MMIAGVMTVESKTRSPNKKKTPFLSANDRSRWCTIRALVEQQEFAIDTMVTGRDKNWKTIDKVRHQGRDGQPHYYSSKPPLLPTLLAGEYWLIRQVTGIGIVEYPFYVGRLILLLSNVLPMFVYLLVLNSVAGRICVTEFGRLYVVAAAAFGTFLTTFSVTINNHLPAAVSILLATVAVIRICYDHQRHIRYFVIAGTFAAFAAANELPALSFLAVVGICLLFQAPVATIVGFFPAVIVIAAAFFGTNYWAHGSWKPPYAHRHDGEFLFRDGPPIDDTTRDGLLPERLRITFVDNGISLSSSSLIRRRSGGQSWEIADPETGLRYAAAETRKSLEVRKWDNWYEYEGSYWSSGKKSGVDRGEPSRMIYAFHVLFGHHGIFSLTPMWILSLGGLALTLCGMRRTMPALAVVTIFLSVVCLIFYIGLRPEQDRNYGGVCSGLRWLFWLIPLWLICMIPAVDRMANSRPGRTIALALLLISVFSAIYPWNNPWTHPWLFRYWEYLGWISY